METRKLLLTVTEAAALLGIGRSLAYELVLRGQLTSVKIGRARRVPVDALDQFIGERLAESNHSTMRGGDAGK